LEVIIFIYRLRHAYVLWDKGFSEDVTFAQFEMAWTSFQSSCKKFDKPSADPKNRIHPTQKPIALYKWLLSKYANPDNKIFDSHVGSGSIRIACHDMGFDFTGCENDPDYWQAQEERFKNHIGQSELFDTKEIQQEIFRELF
jgi:site-specific DNA-methyltransferase (adenine-specific)